MPCSGTRGSSFTWAMREDLCCYEEIHAVELVTKGIRPCRLRLGVRLEDARHIFVVLRSRMSIWRSVWGGVDGSGMRTNMVLRG